MVNVVRTFGRLSWAESGTAFFAGSSRVALPQAAEIKSNPTQISEVLGLLFHTLKQHFPIAIV